jgi:hypothetical protein
MANDLTKNPLKIDTAATILTGKAFRVRSFRWVAKTAQAGNELIVEDTAGRVVFHSVAAAANHMDVYMPGDMIVNGLVVDTIAAGVLYIELA